MPALSLYLGPDLQHVSRSIEPPTEPSAHCTIRQLLELVKLPELERQRRATGTIAKWIRAVEHWEAVTGNPPAMDITRQTLCDFPTDLLAAPLQQIKTPTAANQQLMYVNAILQSSVDWLGMVPQGKPLPLDPPTRHCRAVPEIDLAGMYAACGVATWCTDPDLPAPLVWRAFLSLLINTGARRSEAATMPRTAWHPSPEFPDIPGFDSLTTSTHGWLVFQTPKTARRKRGLPLVLPVAEALANHLRELNRLAPRRQRMFPIGDHPSTWRKQFLKIQKAAGIAEPYTWHDLRKTANRRFRRAAGRDIAEFMLGHSPRGVNAAHYDDCTEDAAAMVAALPQPAGMQGPHIG